MEKLSGMLNSKDKLDFINKEILWYKDNVEDFDEGKICDKYHTFDELYEFRKVYNAALFNEWAKNGKYDVHKSKRHYDGELCFGDDKWFVVVAILPTGQITNHYKVDTDWNLFNIPETPKAKYEFDGHTPKDVIDRLKLTPETCLRSCTTTITPYLYTVKVKREYGERPIIILDTKTKQIDSDEVCFSSTTQLTFDEVMKRLEGTKDIVYIKGEFKGKVKAKGNVPYIY